MKIHHFYSRLRTLESAARTASNLFVDAEEIRHTDEQHKEVKAVNGSKASAQFFQALEEYNFFEAQAFNIGKDLLDILK